MATLTGIAGDLGNANVFPTVNASRFSTDTAAQHLPNCTAPRTLRARSSLRMRLQRMLLQLSSTDIILVAEGDQIALTQRNRLFKIFGRS